MPIGQSDYIVQFLIHYGYALMLPLMIIEGPVTSIVSAFLASLGVFNIFIVFLFSVIGDLAGDSALYGIGRKWGMSFVRRFGKYLWIDEVLVEKMRGLFVRHGGKTVFAVKSTTGLNLVTHLSAGIARMPYGRFIFFSFLGGLIWSGFTVTLGYFFGYLWQQIADYIQYAGWLVGGMALLVFIGVQIYKTKQAREIFNSQ